MAQIGRCANPECNNIIRHYAKKRNRRRIQEYCSRRCWEHVPPAMRDFAEQWFGKPARYSREDVKLALLQARAVHGSIAALARRLVPQRSRRTLQDWFQKLHITREDVRQFRRFGMVLRGPNGSVADVLVPAWKGDERGRE